MREGWQIKSLKEIGETQTGNTPPISDPDNYGNYIPFVKPGDFNIDGTINVNGSGLSEKGLRSARILKANSILMVCIGATIGKTGFSNIPLTSNQQINALTPHEQFEPKFLYYALITDQFLKKVIHASSQATLPIINKSKWENLTVEYPTNKKEQQRIVLILDEAFAAIDQAKANVERNLQNAKELFQSELNIIFTNKGEGWVEKKLSELCETKQQKQEARDKLKDSDLVTFLPMEDLGIGSKSINPVQVKTLKEVSGSYTYFADNDVLLAKITPCFENGKIGIASNLKNGVGFGSSEYIVFRSNGEVTPEFLFYFLSRKTFRDEGKPLMTGAVGHKRVSKDWIENYLLPHPKSLDEQQNIVQRLDTVSTKTKQLERKYQQKLMALDNLKKSILEKAFKGELEEKEIPV